MIAMFREQYKIVVLKCCCSFIQNSSKHFCISCHLSLTCFCITPFVTCSSPCIKFYLQWFVLLPLPLSHSHHFSWNSMICIAVQFWHSDQVLVPFHVHVFFYPFLSATITNFTLYNIGCQLNVIGKCIKTMAACKFHFRLYFFFYLPVKSCNFNYNNLLLLINNDVGVRHCNHRSSSHINGVC